MNEKELFIAHLLALAIDLLVNGRRLYLTGCSFHTLIRDIAVSGDVAFPFSTGEGF